MAQSRKPTDDLKRTAEDLVNFIYGEHQKENKKVLEEALKKAKENKAYKEKGWGTFIYETVVGVSKPNVSIPEPDVYDQINELQKDLSWTEKSLNTLFFQELLKKLPGYDVKASVPLEQLKLIYENMKLKIEKDNISVLQNLSSSALSIAATAAKMYQKDKEEEVVKEKERKAVEQQSITTKIIQQIADLPKEKALSEDFAQAAEKRHQELKVVTEQYQKRVAEDAKNRPSKSKAQETQDRQTDLQNVIAQRQEYLKEERAKQEAEEIEKANQRAQIRPGNVNESMADAWERCRERVGAQSGLAKFRFDALKPKTKREAEELQVPVTVASKRS